MGIACHPGYHTHTSPSPTGCAFPDARKPSGLCGRDPVAVYVNPYAKVLNTYRCDRHDRSVVVEAAAEMGFVRRALDPVEKSNRIAALERIERA